MVISWTSRVHAGHQFGGHPFRQFRDRTANAGCSRFCARGGDEVLGKSAFDPTMPTFAVGPAEAECAPSPEYPKGTPALGRSVPSGLGRRWASPTLPRNVRTRKAGRRPNATSAFGPDRHVDVEAALNIDQFGACGIVSGYSPPCSIISKRKPVPSICGSCGRFSASSLQVCEEASSCPHNQTRRASRGSLRRAGDIGASPKFVAGRIVSLITTTVI